MTKTAIYVATASMVMTALANAADVPFNGSVADTCTMQLVRNGTLGVRADFLRIASGQPGGVHGLASATTNAPGFSLGVVIPNAFDSEPPADLASPEDFSIRWWGTGATTFTSGQITNFTAADERTLNAGTTDIRLRLAAQKPGNVPFAAGTYTATATLRCSS